MEEQLELILELPSEPTTTYKNPSLDDVKQPLREYRYARWLDDSYRQIARTVGAEATHIPLEYTALQIKMLRMEHPYWNGLKGPGGMTIPFPEVKPTRAIGAFYNTFKEGTALRHARAMCARNVLDVIAGEEPTYQPGKNPEGAVTHDWYSLLDQVGQEYLQSKGALANTEFKTEKDNRIRRNITHLLKKAQSIK